jgi:CRISPR/Cas system-associated endoribonuclease Cas2
MVKTFEEWIVDNHTDDEFGNGEIHRKYVNSVFGGNSIPRIKNRNWEILQNGVYETLLKSYDKDKLKQKINEFFGDEIFQYDMDDEVSSKMLVIKYKRDYGFVKTGKFKSLLNLFNYNITFINPSERLVYLEPNVPDEMTKYVYETCNGIVWHITKNKSTFGNIIKYGLKPKTASYRNYSERVFFIAGSGKDEIFKNIRKTKDMFFGSDDHGSLVLLKVDLKRFEKKLRFFMDPTLKGMRAIWTSEYIPPFCINEIKWSDVKDELDGNW